MLLLWVLLIVGSKKRVRSCAPAMHAAKRLENWNGDIRWSGGGSLFVNEDSTSRVAVGRRAVKLKIYV